MVGCTGTQAAWNKTTVGRLLHDCMTNNFSVNLNSKAKSYVSQEIEASAHSNAFGIPTCPKKSPKNTHLLFKTTKVKLHLKEIRPTPYLI